MTLKPKKIFVTGSTDGIGLLTAQHLFLLGHHILVHGRTAERAQEGIRSILKLSGDSSRSSHERLTAVFGDLSVMKEVKQVSEQVARHPDLSVLINNAGVYMNEYKVTVDGFETTLAVNYLAPFLLCHQLWPVLSQQSEARVINVSSIAHTKGHIKLDDLNMSQHFDPYAAYAASKLMDIMLTRCLAALHKNSPVTFNSLHPGVIDTKLLRAGFKVQGDRVDVGCETSVFLATADEVRGLTGRYFVNKKEAMISVGAQNDTLATDLYRKTQQLLKPWL